jgi:Bax protein
MNSSSLRDTLHIAQFVIILLLVLLAVFVAPYPFPSLFTSHKETVLSGADEFGELLASRQASITDLRMGAEALEFQALNLPDDFIDLPLEKRKEQFIALILSHAIQVNTIILHERKKLILYLLDRQSGKYISPQRKAWLQLLARRYGTPARDTEELLRRVDTIPISLTIAQAIKESGWGTSRFALQGNALYGQHLPYNSGKKFILSKYGDVKVAAFDSLFQATTAYMHNLNTTKAYSSLREIRADLRAQGRIPDGHSLAAGLRHYSELGEMYITDIRFLIEQYDLESLENTVFDRSATAMVIRFQRDKQSSLAMQTPEKIEDNIYSSDI